MNRSLPAAALVRLARLCGMFGSEHDGERANAARLADQLLRSHGLTWLALFEVSAEEISVAEMIEACLERSAGLSEWERGFLASLEQWVARRSPLSPKQEAVLTRIFQGLKQSEGA